MPRAMGHKVSCPAFPNSWRELNRCHDAPDGNRDTVPTPPARARPRENKIYPHLLRSVVITRVKPRVWSCHITYIPNGERCSLSGGDNRSGQPSGAGLAFVEHDGHAFLPRRTG